MHYTQIKKLNILLHSRLLSFSVEKRFEQKYRHIGKHTTL